MKNFLHTQSHGITMIMLIIFTYIIKLDLDFLLFGLSGYYIGREIAQAEYKGINKFYKGKRANAPMTVGFEKRNWNRDSFINDLFIPVLLGISYTTFM